MAAAAEHMHAHDVAHGDLYAHNTLHATTRAGIQAKLGDLGAAFAYDRAVYGATLERIEVRRPSSLPHCEITRKGFARFAAASRMVPAPWARSAEGAGVVKWGGGGWRQVRAVGCLLEDLLTTTTCKRAVEFVTEAALRALVHDCLAEPVAARPTLAEVCYTAMKKLRIVILATVWHFVIENGY